MFDNKKVLFYGPGVKKGEPDVGQYDCVILTNYQVVFFFDKHRSLGQTQAWLYINHYFSKKRRKIIGRYLDKICGCLGLQESISRLPRSVQKRCLIVPRQDDWWDETDGKCPLGFTHVLMLLRKYDLKSLDVVGVDYYEGERAYEESGYLSPGLKQRTIEEEREMIDLYRGIEKNKAYFARYAEEQENVRML